MRSNRTSRIQRPVSDAFSFAKSGNKDRLLLVATIHCLRDPSAVIRRIAFVVIGPIYLKIAREAIRVSPLRERNKILPFRANGNPSGSILRIVHMFRILTSLLHAVPNSVESSSSMRSVLPMLSTSSRFCLTSLTATRTRIREQLKCAHISCSAAVTAAWVDRNIVRRCFRDALFMDQTAYNKPRTETRSERYVQGIHGLILA